MKPYVYAALFLIIGNTNSSASTALEVNSSCHYFSNIVVSNSNFQMKQDFATGLCWGAFEVIQNIVRIQFNGEKNPTLNICVPPTSTRIQLIKIVMKYIDNHPEVLNEEFTFVAYRALLNSYPCK